MSAIKNLLRVAHYARSVLAEFGANTRGNVAVISALAALPMMFAVGCVIDYSSAAMIRTRLQAAADAASLASVSINSPVIATAQSMNGNGAVSGGSTYALGFFNANLSAAPATTGYTSLNPTATVSLTKNTITATVSYTAQVPTYFVGLMGSSYKNIAISGTSTATYTLASYLDFYLMLDVSGSMSFPSTTAEQTRLQSVNPDNKNGPYPGGCTFACHFTSQGACGQSTQGPVPAVGSTTNPSPGGYCQGFIISRLGTTPASGTLTAANVNWTNSQVASCSTPGTTSCIQLRADAVGYAVNTLLQTANSSEVVSNQFRVGLYPFIQKLYTYKNLTSALNDADLTNKAANLASLLDTGNNSNLGSGGTHFENAFSSINSIITSVGTGTSPSNTLPYIFLVTDGSQDYQTQWGGGWSSQNWSSTSAVPYQNSATVIPPNSVTTTDYCTQIKSRGIIIAILYIPYQTIQNATSFADSEDVYANATIPKIPGALQTCASPNFFYTANTPTDIQNALIAMFEQAVSTAHISN